jgi:hypothetical protein
MTQNTNTRQNVGTFGFRPRLQEEQSGFSRPYKYAY